MDSLLEKTNKEAWTALCSVVKELGNGTAHKKWGKTLDLHLYHFLPTVTTEQSTVQASLFGKSRLEFSKLKD